MEKIRFAVLLCIRRFQTSEKVNSVLCCTALGKQRHDWIPRACQDARKHIAWLQSDARQSAGKGCLSGICRGRETHSYNDRSCRGGKTSTALLCRYGMTLDLLFESVNGNIIIQMRNRPWWQLFGNSEWFKQMTSDRFIEGKLSKFVAYCAFRVLCGLRAKRIYGYHYNLQQRTEEVQNAPWDYRSTEITGLHLLSGRTAIAVW